jgi:hypothetical protein
MLKKGHFVTLKGHFVTLKGHFVTLKGHFVTLKGHFKGMSLIFILYIIGVINSFDHCIEDVLKNYVIYI